MGIAATRGKSGQMTIELAVAMPVLIIVAVIAVNALVFFADCAAFDRIAHEAIRVHAASPAYGQGADQSCALVQEAIQSEMSGSNVDVSVVHAATGFDFDAYTASMSYHPTLFGMGLRSHVFGIALPSLSHSTTYVVDGYKPGVIV